MVVPMLHCRTQGNNRKILLDICRKTMLRMVNRMSDVKDRTWGEKLNYPFIDFLLVKTICINPTENCNLIGNKEEWKNLPAEKSLFKSGNDCGLPIGNLSSQLFSNIYLNEFDQYVKRTLKCKHYGRYVDDAYIVSGSREHLLSLVEAINVFLATNLGLSLQKSKTKIINAYQGVEFLGAYIRAYRSYISSSSLRRKTKKLHVMHVSDANTLCSSVNSFLGVMSHYRSYCLRKVIFANNPILTFNGGFSNDVLKYTPFCKCNNH